MSWRAPIRYAALLLPLFLACGGNTPTSVAVGRPLPEATFQRLDGGSIETTAWRGAPTVLSFWATWCRPCRREFPVLNTLHAEGIRVLAIALDDAGATVVRPFVEQNDLRYPVALGDKAVLRRFGGNAIPTTLVIDGNGVVVAHHVGAVSLNTLRRALDTLPPTS